MATSSGSSPSSTTTRVPLRLQLGDPDSPEGAAGAWWPQSRDLQAEAADLVDNFPDSAGRIHRLLYSRPDWDDATVDGHGVRRIKAGRGPVKVGSFPKDDTHLMVVSLASGRRLKLTVIPSDADAADGERRLHSTA